MSTPGEPEEQVQWGQKGYRRMKIAAMAGTLYNRGQAAVSEIQKQYAQTRPALDGGHDGHGRTHIPGAFPDVDIRVKGNDQMVLFPSYAKRHVKKDWSNPAESATQGPQGATQEEHFWKNEWDRNEDERAIVDVDVRGWVYSPSSGPMNRRDRMAIGIARRLSGIVAPKTEQPAADAGEGGLRAQHQMHEAQRDQERIEREAEEIERRGLQEKQAAGRGEYSERPQPANSETGSMYNYKTGQGNGSGSAPSSPTRTATQYSTGGASTEMSEAEYAVANTNLMARIAPFMTNPSVSLPVTIFFYNDSKSQSRTVITNDAGHFNFRAPLDFVPTHVRVLANEGLSAIQEVQITEPYGVSLISDVDDTIKRSNISSGAKEIFRNTFVRDLGELVVEGVKEWYGRLHANDVKIHYCSNSPWQLYPVLASYFKRSGLPPGSLHLKQYSGMLQGIFEPVAERKKSTLERLIRDFPQRKFILVGDSGEADLEVYTELAMANPKSILAIFIRDVTTPERVDFFQNSFGGLKSKVSNLSLRDQGFNDTGSRRRNTAPDAPQAQETSSGPTMGDLIDLSEEPKQAALDKAQAPDQVRKPTAHRKGSASDLLAARKAPPPRPNKPMALRSTSSLNKSDEDAAPPLPARKPVPSGANAPHPLSQIRNPSSQTVNSSPASTPGSQSQRRDSGRQPPQPPPPRRRGTPSSVVSNANSDIDYDPLPASTSTLPLGRVVARSSARSRADSPTSSPQFGAQQPTALDRKIELWSRRLERAHQELDRLGISLYTWRRGQDVVEEAMGLVRQAQQDMKRRGKEMHPLEDAAKRDRY